MHVAIVAACSGSPPQCSTFSSSNDVQYEVLEPCTGTHVQTTTDDGRSSIPMQPGNEVDNGH